MAERNDLGDLYIGSGKEEGRICSDYPFSIAYFNRLVFCLFFNVSINPPFLLSFPPPKQEKK